MTPTDLRRAVVDLSSATTVFARVQARTELSLAPVELAAHRLLSRSLDPQELDDARDAATTLATALGRLQHQGVADPARRIVALLESDDPDHGVGVELAGAVEDTRTMLASAAAQLAANPARTSTILAIGEPRAAFDTVLWVLAHHGHAVHHSPGLDPDADTDTEPEPDAIVVHVGPEVDTFATTVLPALAELHECPVIVLHGLLPADDRSRLARHASTLLVDTTDPVVISEELLRLRAAAETARRVAVWGHPAAAALLSAHGYDVTAVADLEDLDAAVAAAVVLGPELPVRARHQATRLLRVNPATRRIPVVWEGVLSEPQALAAAHLGATVVARFDDAAAAALTSEIRRAAADVDPAVNRPDAVLAWTAARLLIDRLLIASQRANSPATVAVVRVADDDNRQREAAHQLAQEFRRDDVVGHSEAGDFVVSLAGIGSRTALDRLSGLARRLGPDTRIGVADFPAGGRSADELVKAATAAIGRAHATDGPAVVSIGWRPAATQPTDVMIVDRDVVLGDMVGVALAGQGLRVSVIEDGNEALSHLLACTPEELPRLLLVDLDLGGADGRALLSSLAQTGVLADVRVLAMASKGTENDLQIALDHGAADVIRKPFPMTILRHRVAQVLGT